MNEIIYLIANPVGFFLTGIILGLFFFCGLWWTTSKVITDSRSPLWFLVSFVIRISVTGTGFYLLASVSWSAVLTSLIGFMISRVWVSHYLGLSALSRSSNSSTRDNSYAPES